MSMRKTAVFFSVIIFIRCTVRVQLCRFEWRRCRPSALPHCVPVPPRPPHPGSALSVQRGLPISPPSFTCGRQHQSFDQKQSFSTNETSGKERESNLRARRWTRERPLWTTRPTPHRLVTRSPPKSRKGRRLTLGTRSKSCTARCAPCRRKCMSIIREISFKSKLACCR